MTKMETQWKNEWGGKTEYNSQESQDILKHSNICIIKILEVEDKERDTNSGRNNGQDLSKFNVRPEKLREHKVGMISHTPHS